MDNRHSTYFFSVVDDPDDPTPNEDHAEDDDNDETEEVVPEDAKGTSVEDVPAGE